MKILYLHGLGSSGQSSTVMGLKELGLNVLAPDYSPHNFKESRRALIEIVENEEPDFIVGTSMGGYYALMLYKHYAMPTVAVNPCFMPRQWLEKYVDEPAWDFANDRPINFTKTMLYEFEPLGDVYFEKDSCRVLIGLRDSLIPPKLQLDVCEYSGWNYSPVDWGHRVESVNVLSKMIDSVYQLSIKKSKYVMGSSK